MIIVGSDLSYFPKVWLRGRSLHKQVVVVGIRLGLAHSGHWVAACMQVVLKQVSLCIASYFHTETDYCPTNCHEYANSCSYTTSTGDV